MTAKRLNPNHPVLRNAEDHWLKIAALLLLKLPDAKALITAEDLAKLASHFGGEMPTIVLHDRADGMHLYLVPESKAQVLASKEGGLPI